MHLSPSLPRDEGDLLTWPMAQGKRAETTSTCLLFYKMGRKVLLPSVVLPEVFLENTAHPTKGAELSFPMAKKADNVS